MGVLSCIYKITPDSSRGAVRCRAKHRQPAPDRYLTPLTQECGDEAPLFACPACPAARGVCDQPGYDDRQRRAADACARTARVEQRTAVDRRRLQPRVRRLPAGSRQPVRPTRAQGHAARGARGVRLGERRRGPGDQLLAADRRALCHGTGRGHGVPGDVVADLQHLHRAGRASTRDRALGRHSGYGDCARADRRRLAAGALLLGQHLLRNGSGRCARRVACGSLRPQLRAR